MLQTFRNAWKIEDLRRKILFTLFMVLLYRLGSAVLVPYVNTELLKQYFDQTLQSSILGLHNVMSGGAFSTATIFALGIQPYINASIIIQLLCIAIPALERLSKDGGEEGRKKINDITRYSTVGIGLLQGWAYYTLISRNNLLTSNAPGVWAAVVIILTFTAGSALLMWMGEQITEFGIGNGISIILFAGIVSRFPTGIINLMNKARAGTLSWLATVLMLLGALAMIVMIVIVNDAERRIPVQYAKRVVGRKMYGGQSTHIPLKVNMSGVMPVIFASSILSLPPTIELFVKNPNNFWAGFFSVFKSTHWAYAIIYFVLIIAFAYFYASIQYNPIEMANNIRKNSGAIPGIRPGKPTSDYIARILNRIVLLGALLLSVVALFPIIFSQVTSLITIKGVNYAMNISLGGTSIIIMVGVALETVKQLESQMMMRHYKGFLD